MARSGKQKGSVDPVPIPEPDERLKRLLERRRYVRLSDDEAALLQGLKARFRQSARRIVERFYDHLTRFETLRTMLGDAERVERLKAFQREYLISLTSGTYDQAYFDNRLRIGQVHETLGVSPQWYIGAFTIYLEELIPIAQRHYGDDPRKAAAATQALIKVMNLDMQIALDAYFEARQQKALERAERLAAVGELAASIAHEVRNPLAGMKGAMEVLRKDLEADPAKTEVVDELVAQIIRLETLVRDLLTFARPRPLNTQPVDLNGLLDRVLRFAVEDREAAGVTIEREFDPALPIVAVDPQQLEQVFLNLIQNALQAMDQGTLAVKTRPVDGAVQIVFRDEGRGIAPADLGRVFQPFFTTRHRGSGLGLAIVQKIVETHGGDIRMESEPGKGTTATLTLPREAGE